MNTAQPTPCKTCLGPRAWPLRGYAAKRGFCSNDCACRWVPVLRSVLCANETCKRGEGARKVFTTYIARARCCSQPCQNIVRQREVHGWKARGVIGLPKPRRPKERIPVHQDLPADTIDKMLATMAARRKATRSWLRIEDPYAQRPGSALHETALITHEMDTEGAYL